jgi:hypothetical protein
MFTRYSTFSTTTELLQSVESENTGDTSTSGKVKASAVAPEPIREEQTEDGNQEELTMREELEMKQVPKEKNEDPKDKMDRSDMLKEKLEGMTKNKEQPKELKEEGSQMLTMKLKENKGKPEEEIEVKIPRKTEELVKDREQLKQDKEENIQQRAEELIENKKEKNQWKAEVKAKEEERSRQMTTLEPKESKEEVKRKNKVSIERIEAGYGPNLTSKKSGEVEEDFPGSPSFRFYCRDIQSFDSDDSVVLSGFRRSSK